MYIVCFVYMKFQNLQMLEKLQCEHVLRNFYDLGNLLSQIEWQCIILWVFFICCVYSYIPHSLLYTLAPVSLSMTALFRVTC